MGSMICAHGYGKDACQGDSGGPAILTDNSSGMSYQSAIISWGDSCGVAPGVYTNLESPTIMNFINERMCQRLVPEMCTNGIFYGVQSKYTNGNILSNPESTQIDDKIEEIIEDVEAINTNIEVSNDINDTKIDVSKIGVSNDTKVESVNEANTANNNEIIALYVIIIIVFGALVCIIFLIYQNKITSLKDTRNRSEMSE